MPAIHAARPSRLWPGCGSGRSDREGGRPFELDHQTTLSILLPDSRIATRQQGDRSLEGVLKFKYPSTQGPRGQKSEVRGQKSEVRSQRSGHDICDLRFPTTQAYDPT